MARFQQMQPSSAGGPALGSLPPQGFRPALHGQTNFKAQSTAISYPDQTSILPALGFFLLCVYLLAGFANDLSIRLLGSRAYLSYITGFLLPIVTLLSGRLITALQFPVGRCWLLFYFWLMLATVFSSWRGGSFMLIQEFGTKNFSILFYIAATVITFRQQARLMHVCVASLVAVLFSCFAFGDYFAGRLTIPGSIFFDNSNDLALYLILSALQTSYLLYSSKTITKLFGLSLIATSVYMILKTGSRATFLSLIACFVVALVLSRKRFLLIAGVIPIIAGSLMLAPSYALNRLVNIIWSIQEQDLSTMDGAQMSQLERTDVFWRSVNMTIHHPLLGVGPGQFPETIAKEARERGVHMTWLNPHNSYTQVSSESGLIGLIFYTGTLLLAIGLSYRAYNLSLTHANLEHFEGMALALFLALIAYSINSFFHHVAYGRMLPILAGMSLTNWILASDAIKQAQGSLRNTVFPARKPVYRR